MLSLRAVTRRARDGDRALTLLRDVSLDVPRGALALLLGPTGSGKSTLIAVAAALTHVDDGEVCWEGESLARAREARRAEYRRDIAAVALQSPLLVEGMTTRECLALTRGVTRDEALAALGVSHRLDDRVERLSTGERQRVALARALGSRCPLLLLDEPSASLDDDAVGSLSALLEGHRAKGGAALVTTHDPRLRGALQWTQTHSLREGTLGPAVP